MPCESYGLACHRAGLGDTPDIYSWIAQQSGSASNSFGDISRGLLAAGLSVAAIQNALNVISSNVQLNPAQLSAVNAELTYLNTYGTTPPRSNSGTLLLVVGVAVLAWLAAKSR